MSIASSVTGFAKGTGLRWGKRAARFAGRKTLNAAERGISGAGSLLTRGPVDWAVNHPKASLGAALGLGVLAARPLGPAYEEVVNQGILGAPHATRSLVGAQVSGSVQQSFASSEDRRAISGGYRYSRGQFDYMQPGGLKMGATLPGQISTASGSRFAAGPNIPNYRSTPYSAPQGHLVLGMYNLR